MLGYCRYGSKIGICSWHPQRGNSFDIRANRARHTVRVVASLPRRDELIIPSCKLWQSLYIMDCFLSSSLGRPNAISCACVSELCPPTLTQQSDDNHQLNNLLASVNASKITSEILSRVYQKRKAVRSISYALSLQFSEWMKALPMRLHWRQISLDPQDPVLTLERLHINLIYFHGIILLTRPFLLYQISLQLKRTSNQPTESAHELQEQSGQSWNGKPEQVFCFHGACVRSAIHTINAVHAVFTSEALPRRDPFVMYAILFSSFLINIHPFSLKLISLQILALFSNSCYSSKHLLPRVL